MSNEAMRKAILGYLYNGPMSPRKIEGYLRSQNRYGSFEEITRMRLHGLLEVNDDLKLQLTEQGRETALAAQRATFWGLPSRPLTDGEMSILHILHMRAGEGVTCSGLCGSYGMSPGLTGDPDLTRALLDSLKGMGLATDYENGQTVCDLSVWHITDAGRDMVMAKPVITGVDYGSGPAKTVCVVASHDRLAEVPFTIHEVFEVARWEETETHVLGYAPDGSLVARGNKDALRQIGFATFVGMEPIKAKTQIQHVDHVRAQGAELPVTPWEGS